MEDRNGIGATVVRQWLVNVVVTAVLGLTVVPGAVATRLTGGGGLTRSSVK